VTDPVVNPAALEPLYGPADVPNLHRVKAKVPGQPAEVRKGRRPTPVAIAQDLRRYVAEWREAQYPGASDTSQELLHHWFGQSHEVSAPDGSRYPFSYYFCQREAIETLIYLYEVRGIRTLSGLTDEFGLAEPEDRRIAALGIHPDEDLWPRYAFKVATGAGKTKIMSLAIVWSYFHALRESDSPMARHFVLVAPGITVFERLKEDFGGGLIFDRDPLIPSAWRGDWNVSVVLQDEAAGAATGGVIYLTNIHRLYDPSRRTREAETYEFMGPSVSKTKALDTAQALRARITSHPRLMVMNDEAHHVWDPDSAWNDAIKFLSETTRKRGGGLVAQLDFSATPKDEKGNVFQHVVVDTPLGEAVDAGIVKTPVIGRGESLVPQASDNAGQKYEHHLLVGYRRWLASKDEWDKSGKKSLLFVMTENTEAADQIARRLNGDPLFRELNGKTVNLHTNLKGKLKKRGKGATSFYEFIESEKDISDDDLHELRKLSRELDDSSSPYRCIVSVLMLREGWDVRNVTTIVPLRPLTATSRILPEQTLGRGLRRMTPPGPGAPAEVVSVVEHPSFIGLYEEQLSQEGLPLEVVDIEQVPRTTVTIYPDPSKDLSKLDLVIPRLSPGYSTSSSLEGLTFEAVRDGFKRAGFKPLPLGTPVKTDIQYEGRHLITDEVVERMKISLPLLSDGMGAVSFFRQELEQVARIRGQHAALAPLIDRFLCEVLFGERVTLYDQRLLPRLSHPDVREHVRATFLPLILKAITRQEQRLPEEAPRSVTAWRPYQATHSERRPTASSPRTPFNLAPCENQLEMAMVQFLTKAKDVAAFAKNAGPQALRMDYLTTDGRRATYTPDFIVRDAGGDYYIAETKGRADVDVAPKARAAVEWCKAASAAEKKVKWQYLYVPEKVFQGASGVSVDELARSCRPSLAMVLKQATEAQQSLKLEVTEEDKIAEQVRDFIDPAVLAALPSRYKKAVADAAAVFHFFEKKEDTSFGPCFQPLLGPIDHAAEAVMRGSLEAAVPIAAAEQRDYFEPDLSKLQKTQAAYLKDKAGLLKKLIVFRAPLMPTGLLLFCLDYAAKADEGLPGVFATVRTKFAPLAQGDLPNLVKNVYDFRNTYIAHAKAELTEKDRARAALTQWVKTLIALHAAVVA
jgi:type III restriction enzyme